MPLQGSLGPLGLAEVLQTGLAGRSAGNLLIRQGPARALLHISDEGLFLHEPEILEAQEILRSFVATGKLAEETLAEALAATPDAVTVLDHLIESGQVPQQEVVDILAGAVEDAVVDLLTWREGEFRFEEGAAPPAGRGLTNRVCIDTGTLLLRAAQRLDEREEVHDILGRHAVLFFPHDPNAFTFEYEGPHAVVTAHVDGHAIIDEVALRSGLGRFTALKVVMDLTKAGVTRLPFAEELAAAADARAAAGEFRVARAILLQWAEREPLETAPFERMADVAARGGHAPEEADASIDLGRVYLATSRPREAAEAFRRALERRPHDRDALVGLREAARANGDDEVFRKTTVELATDALAKEDAEDTAALLAELPPEAINSLDVRMLRTRALLKLKDRVAVVAEIEAIAGLLGPRARRKPERDAASFCRDAVAHVAPERSDLLRRFRQLAEGGRVRPRRVAVLLALAAVLGTVGWLVWPKGPASLLADAEAAMTAGDTPGALALLAQVIERWPDAPEAEAALRLQGSLTKPTDPTDLPALRATDPVYRKELEAALPGWIGTLHRLPSPAGREALAALVAKLEDAKGAPMRSAAVRQAMPALADVMRNVTIETRVRTDALGKLRALASAGPRAKPAALRAALDEVERGLSDDLPVALAETAEIMARLLKLDPDNGAVRAWLRDVEENARVVRTSREAYGPEIGECRRLLAGFELEAEYEACREQAPKLLVAGQIDDADALYARLEGRLVAMEVDPVLAPVFEGARRRQIPQFVRERRGVIAEIRQGMAAAAASEKAGDVPAAVAAYAALAKRFWMVRFENVFTLPLLVETVPAGARVSLNGKDQGVSPVTVRYGWGSQTTLTLEAPGYEVASEVLRTAEDQPKANLRVHLVPKARWTAAVDPGVVLRPVAVGEDLLLVDRNGRHTLYQGRDGRVVWTRQVKSLEGIRHRPAAVPGLIVSPFVDGRVTFYNTRDGNVIETVEGARPAGDAASLEDVAVYPTVQRTLVAYRGRRPLFTAELSGDVSAGALAAHGAFWVGTVAGDLERIDPLSGRVTSVRLEPAKALVLGIAPTAGGLLVLTGDGYLFAVDATGKVRWHTEGLGDVVGQPAQAGDRAACTDRQGRILLFDATTGEPKGQLLAGSEPNGGLLSVRGLLLAVLADGRLFAHEPAQGRTLVDVAIRGDGPRFPPGLLPDDRVVMPGPGATVAVFAAAALLPVAEGAAER